MFGVRLAETQTNKRFFLVLKVHLVTHDGKFWRLQLKMNIVFVSVVYLLLYFKWWSKLVIFTVFNPQERLYYVSSVMSVIEKDLEQVRFCEVQWYLVLHRVFE